MTETLTGKPVDEWSTPETFVAHYSARYLFPAMTACFIPCGRQPLGLIVALAEVRAAERGRRQRVELGRLGPHGPLIKDATEEAPDVP